MSEKKTGYRKAKKVTAVEVEVPPASESWVDRWNGWKLMVLSEDAPTLSSACIHAENYFPMGGMFLAFASEFVDAKAGGRKLWARFVERVEADLVLESSEPDGELASFPEFLEAVARQIDQVLLTYRPWWYVVTKHGNVTGRSRPTAVPHVLAPLSLAMKRWVQWNGEGVARAGEQIPQPVWDPNWTPEPGKPFPWSGWE